MYETGKFEMDSVHEIEAIGIGSYLQNVILNLRKRPCGRFSCA